MDFEYCAEVLLIAVSQRPGCAGLGHGTRMVNYIRALIGSLPPPRPPLSSTHPSGEAPWYTDEDSGSRGLPRSRRHQSGARAMVTQADDGMQAVSFWGKQGYEAGEEADRMIHMLEVCSALCP